MVTTSACHHPCLVSYPRIRARGLNRMRILSWSCLLGWRDVAIVELIPSPIHRAPPYCRVVPSPKPSTNQPVVRWNREGSWSGTSVMLRDSDEVVMQSNEGVSLRVRRSSRPPQAVGRHIKVFYRVFDAVLKVSGSSVKGGCRKDRSGGGVPRSCRGCICSTGIV